MNDQVEIDFALDRNDGVVNGSIIFRTLFIDFDPIDADDDDDVVFFVLLKTQTSPLQMNRLERSPELFS